MRQQGCIRPAFAAGIALSVLSAAVPAGAGEGRAGLPAADTRAESGAQSCRAGAIGSELFGRADGRVLVVAHRGAHDTVPENSLESIDRAVAIGAAVVELDVRRTADGEYVLMHDSTLDRTTTLQGEIATKTLAELRDARLRLGDGTPTDARVPTFAEALRAAKGRIWVMIDSKVDRPGDVAEIIRIAREAGILGQTILYDFDPTVLLSYRALAPEAKVMGRTKQREQIVATIFQTKPDIFHIEPAFSDRELAGYFDALQLPTWLNVLNEIDQLAVTAGDEAAYGPIVDSRPDIVQTDRPAELIALLRLRGMYPQALDTAACG